MIELKLSLPINSYRVEKQQAILDAFSDFELKWRFHELGEVVFSKSIQTATVRDDNYEDDLTRVRNLLEANPEDESLRQELQYWIEKSANDFIYQTEVVFTCNIGVTMDHNPSIFFLDTDTDKVTPYDWDEFYAYDLKRLTMAFILSVVLSHPEISIACAPVVTYIDGQMYKNELHMLFAWHNDAYLAHQELFSTSIGIQDTFIWIQRNSDLLTTNANPTVAVSALSYLLNRDIHENLIYSIIGLESLHVPEDKGVVNLLSKRIACLFPSVPQSKVKEMYRMRSKFVHGNMYMDVYSIIRPKFSEEDQEVEEVALLATALLLESLRKLVANNALGFTYSTHISFSYTM